MITRIEVASKHADSRSFVFKKKLEEMGFASKIRNVTLLDVYSIDRKFSSANLKQICGLLVNPVTQQAYFNEFPPRQKFTFAVEVGFLPGVTDNVAATAKEMIEDFLKMKFSAGEGVYTSTLYLIQGKLTPPDMQQIAGSLINPLIQRVHVKSNAQYSKDKGMDKIIPRVKLKEKIQVHKVSLDVSDEELIKIGKEGIKNKDARNGPLALDLLSMKAIQAHFKKLNRPPTDLELESIAQTWSEHCKHTIFANAIDEIKEGLFNKYIRGATKRILDQKKRKDFCTSVFKDNSGAISFDKKYLITHKVETHNSPSALDPFGGAVTGIVGVNRDAIGFGKGAKPIVNTYGFCFAPPRNKLELFRDKNLTQKMLSAARIMSGVIAGVNSGGNCSGIPTPQGFVVFDDRFRGKPLVYVGTVGLIPKKINGRSSCFKKAWPGDLIVVVGGRVGQDGIHGATFSSEAMTAGSPATAVQIGDPITQKKLSDALIKEARDLNLYHSITDNGAGGLSCSVAEMAKEAGSPRSPRFGEAGGFEVYLDKVPLKYPGLSPWKIWVSESQERMTLAVPKNKWRAFFDLMKRRGVEATVIGKFTGSGKCIVKYKNKTIMNLSMEFLHEGLPPRQLKTREVIAKTSMATIPQGKNLTQVLKQMLSQLNICSFEFISCQYDHEVQGNSVIKPLQGRGRVNGEATVIRPVLNSKKGIILSQGIYPELGDTDTYQMAVLCIDTAIRNAVAAGADIERLALLDNFCWCNGNNPKRLWQLKKAAQACYDLSTFFGTPFISGKDSMFNDFKGFDKNGKPLMISIPPTLLISSVGVIDDVTRAVSLDAKMPGDLIYLLDASGRKKLYQDYHKCVEKNLISAAIAVNRGGLAVSAAKMAISGMLGIEIHVARDAEMFSERTGRILISINPKNNVVFEKIMKGNYFSQIGKVTDKDNILIKEKSAKTIVNLKLSQALASYRKRSKGY